MVNTVLLKRGPPECCFENEFLISDSIKNEFRLYFKTVNVRELNVIFSFLLKMLS